MRKTIKKIVTSCIVLFGVLGTTLPTYAADVTNETEPVAAVYCTDATHVHSTTTNSISTFAVAPKCTRCGTNKCVVPHGLVCFVCMQCGTYMWA